jgi:IclR helix-turn-helix domain
MEAGPMPLRKRAGGRGPVDQSTVRLHNLGVVLRHVADHGPRSRARIAAETGLNKTTVSSLTSELIERGLLRDAGSDGPRGVGRPGLELELSGESVAALGLEINVDYLAACATDFAGRANLNEGITSSRAEPSCGPLSLHRLSPRLHRRRRVRPSRAYEKPIHSFLVAPVLTCCPDEPYEGDRKRHERHHDRYKRHPGHRNCCTRRPDMGNGIHRCPAGARTNG